MSSKKTCRILCRAAFLEGLYTYQHHLDACNVSNLMFCKTLYKEMTNALMRA